MIQLIIFITMYSYVYSYNIIDYEKQTKQTFIQFSGEFIKVELMVKKEARVDYLKNTLKKYSLYRSGSEWRTYAAALANAGEMNGRGEPIYTHKAKPIRWVTLNRRLYLTEFISN